MIVVAGSPKSTNMPSHSFDKVLVRETFHHFEHPEAMLADIVRMPRADGRIYMVEPDVETTFFNKNCNSLNYSRTDLKSFFAKAELEIIETHDLSHLPSYTVPWMPYDKEGEPPLIVYVLGKKSE